jgi:polar amino acid transport system substrate-binding protein
MRTKGFSIILLLAFAAIIMLWCPAAQAEPLKVGVWDSPPYVMAKHPGLIGGMSAQVWKVMAKLAGIDYEVVVFKDIDEIMDALAAGSIDASIGPHAATAARAEKVLFTQPYFTTGIGILTHADPPRPWERIRPFLTKGFVMAVISLCLLLMVVGHLLWVFERRHNPANFPHSWPKGIASGMWLAVSAFTSVGFGDIVPKTRGGRIVCGIWMIISMVAATTLTAGVATVLTTSFTAEYMPEQSLDNPAQLRGKRVMAISGTHSDKLIQHYGGSVAYRENIAAAVQGILDRQFDALVFDRMALVYYLESNPNKDLKVTNILLEKDSLAFAFGPDKYRECRKVSVQLLTMHESGALDDIVNSWIASIRQNETRNTRKDKK